MVTAKQVSEKKVQKKTQPIKYADKSAGQENLIPIFDRLKQVLSKFVKGSVIIKGEAPGLFNLYSEKEFHLAGKTFPEVCFAGILIQKGYVGFYFMPIYTHKTEVEKFIQPGLLKHLKGKSCFHIKKYDEDLFNQVENALQEGAEFIAQKI